MTRVNVHISKRSANSKVGKIPVTTSSQGTCPTTCPMWDGCYAKTGPQSWHWRKVTEGERGGSWDDLASFVSQLNAGQLWRHNVSGDLFYDTAPDGQELINLAMLKQLIDANKSSQAKGYTYTHHLLNTHNKEAIKYSNSNGFTINCSTESLEAADAAMNEGMPAVTVIPSDHKAVESYKVTYQGKKQELFKVKEKITTPDGRKVVVCPAQTCAPTKCETCKLCSKSDRDFVVAFVAHGGGKKKVDTFLNN